MAHLKRTSVLWASVLEGSSAEAGCDVNLDVDHHALAPAQPTVLCSSRSNVKTGSMLGTLYTFGGMGFLIFM